MSLVKVRCVLVPHECGTKRLTMMDTKALEQLVREGKAVQKGCALWEVLGDAEAKPAPAPAAKPQTEASKPQANKPQQTQQSAAHKPHPHTQGKKHGSKAK